MDETRPQMPAPERDLQNVPPHVPPASRDVSPVTQAVFATPAIGLGIAMMVMAVLALLFQASPVPDSVLGRDAVAAWWLVGLSGLFFVGCGVAIMRRSLLLTVVLLILAVLCGWMASVIA
jgi:hypothetical protein